MADTARWVEVRAAHQALRALVDCGAISTGHRLPVQFAAAKRVGWAKQTSRWTGKAFVHVFTLAISRERGSNILSGGQ